MIFKRTTSSNNPDHEHWISVSDLMSGLMMVFLFISIALMRHAFVERDKIKDVAKAYETTQIAIYESLKSEFEPDLQRWSAKINKDTLSVEFENTEVLFQMGSATLQPRFEEILNDFFPRYIKSLKPYRNSITEIRIEGHASSYWSIDATPERAYANNMVLSQARTRSVLFYILNMTRTNEEKDWLRKHIAAIGFSSSHLVMKNGREDPRASRRVTFRLLTNAEQQIRRILGTENENQN